jgi:hypothetical protein
LAIPFLSKEDEKRKKIIKMKKVKKKWKKIMSGE